MLKQTEKEGYLIKQGKIVRSWKRRWFVLTGSTLYYFKSKGDAEAAGAIPLQRCTVHVNRAKKYSFEVGTQQNRTFYLQAEDQTTMDEWIRVIERASGQGEGSTDHHHTTFNNSNISTSPSITAVSLIDFQNNINFKTVICFN
jgi:hypothetical protein